MALKARSDEISKLKKKLFVVANFIRYALSGG